MMAEGDGQFGQLGRNINAKERSPTETINRRYLGFKRTKDILTSISR